MLHPLQLPARQAQRLRDEPLGPAALLTHAYLTLMLSGYLLWFDSRGLTAITAAKRNAYYALTLGYFALLAACLAWLLAARPAARAALRQRLRRVCPALWCMLAYLLLTLLSALASPFKAAVWLGASRNEGFVTHALYVLSFACTALFTRPRMRHAYVLGAGLTLFGTVCVLHIAGIDPLGLFPSGRSYQNTGGQYIGTVGNIGFVGALLCLAIPVLCGVLLRGRGRNRLWLLLPLALCLFVLLRIRVAAAAVGLGAGVLFCVPVVLRFSAIRTRRRRIALGAAALAALAALWLLDPPVQELHELHELLHGRCSDSFGTGRFYIWRQTLERIPERLWLGTGPDTMLLARLAPFSRVDGATGKTVYAAIDAAHNEYLNILFHQGIFALGAYLAGLAFALRRFFRLGRENAAAAIGGAAVLCYAVEALFGISQPLTTPFFWLALGLLCMPEAQSSSSDVPSSSSPTGQWSEPKISE